VNVNWDKPYLSIDNQLKKLSSEYNLRIEDIDVAREALSSISYYTIINGYKKTFLQPESQDKFRDGTTFAMLYALHWIDISLSDILFKYILLIEKSLKTKVAGVVSAEFGVDARSYLDFHNYSNYDQERSSLITYLKKELASPREHTPTHYYKETKNHVPAWILVNDIDFFHAISWYRHLKGNQKTAVASQFFTATNTSLDDKQKFLVKLTELLRAFRNQVAHGRRTFAFRSDSSLPKDFQRLLPDGVVSKNNLKDSRKMHGLFAVMLTIPLLINDRYILSNYEYELNTLLHPYSEKQNAKMFLGKSMYKLFNVPEDVLDRIHKIYDFKFSN
jgi:abortive infection bacteriophage resistance protein